MFLSFHLHQSLLFEANHFYQRALPQNIGPKQHSALAPAVPRPGAIYLFPRTLLGVRVNNDISPIGTFAASAIGERQSGQCKCFFRTLHPHRSSGRHSCIACLLPSAPAGSLLEILRCRSVSICSVAYMRIFRREAARSLDKWDSVRCRQIKISFHIHIEPHAVNIVRGCTNHDMMLSQVSLAN